jgi:hypothetical protein
MSRRLEELPPKKFPNNQYTFEERLAQLADYKEKNGHCNVPHCFKGYGNLGNWVGKQRQKYSKEKRPKSMTKERICALEKLGFVWRLDKRSRPIKKSTTPTERTDNSDNNNTVYDTKRISALLSGNDSAGAAVIKESSSTINNGAANKRRKLDSSNNGNFSAAITYDNVGETSMSIDGSINSDDNWSTAAAVITANTRISGGQDNHNNNQTTNSRISAAANAASSSTVLSTALHTKTRKYHTFEVRLAQLADYKEKNGHCNVPYRFKEYGHIGGWVSNQRRHYKNYKENRPGPITKERICALEELDFKWRLDSHVRPLEEQISAPVTQTENGNNEVDQLFEKNKIIIIIISSSSSNHHHHDSDSDSDAYNKEDDGGGWHDLGDAYYDSDGDCLSDV